MYNILQEKKDETCSEEHVDDSSRFTPIRIHEEEPEASQAKYTMVKERASEEYKENGISTSRDEYHLGTRNHPR